MDLKYLFVSRLANPNLQWEKTTSWNVGLDVGFLTIGSMQVWNIM